MKDALPNENNFECRIGNSFKVTIKSGDASHQSRFVFDNFMTKENNLKNELFDEMPLSADIVSSKNDQFVASINNDDYADPANKSSVSSYHNRNQLSIADFSRATQFEDASRQSRKKIPNVSNSNSNNSTILINSLSPASSSSLSNTPLRGSLNNTIDRLIDCKIVPSSASSALSASNTIKFILNSQIAATSQREASE